MVCNIIDECRCFAYSDVYDVKRNQFCGVRRGSHVINCSVDCCSGGCPTNDNNLEPREPFRIIKRPQIPEQSNFDVRLMLILLYILSLFAFVIYIT